MEILPTELPDVRLIRPRTFADSRGSFVKTFHAPAFQNAGIGFIPQEEFFSVSHKNVIRGMHFQTPPQAQARLVYCLAGRILDVVMDLRKNSPAFSRVVARELSAANREMLFIPEGFAHGFLSLEDHSLVGYSASRPHSPPHDAGIAWNSIGFQWPVASQILSGRDQNFPSLHEFQSPY